MLVGQDSLSLRWRVSFAAFMLGLTLQAKPEQHKTHAHEQHAGAYARRGLAAEQNQGWSAEGKAGPDKGCCVGKPRYR